MASRTSSLQTVCHPLSQNVCQSTTYGKYLFPQWFAQRWELFTTCCRLCFEAEDGTSLAIYRFSLCAHQCRSSFMFNTRVVFIVQLIAFYCAFVLRFQENQVKEEELKLLKAKAEEEAVARAQIESQTADAMNVHEKQLALVIGRLLTRQARKQATPTACLDPTIAKLEVSWSLSPGRVSLFVRLLAFILKVGTISRAPYVLGSTTRAPEH